MPAPVSRVLTEVRGCFSFQPGRLLGRARTMELQMGYMTPDYIMLKNLILSLNVMCRTLPVDVPLF